MKTREIHLASRPHGEPAAENFRIETRELPPLKDGEILVKNIVMSVDPYMRGRMNDVKSYVPPFKLDAAMDGGAVGEVLESRADGINAGDVVLHGLGWREHAILPGDKAIVVDADAAPASAYLGVLGMPGITAYGGLMRIAEFNAGDAVFVSGAAGAVGSLVGQIARLEGASRIVGSAGSAEKVARLSELGFDAAFNYKDGDIRDQLAKAAPDGIDVYFDNVGGEHLEAAIWQLNMHGRVAMCGAIAQYNATEAPAGPRNLGLMIGKRIRMQGFIQSDFADLIPEFQQKMTAWLREGKITWDETRVSGLDAAPQAFIDLLRGGNTGKMIVDLS